MSVVQQYFFLCTDTVKARKKSSSIRLITQRGEDIKIGAASLPFWNLAYDFSEQTRNKYKHNKATQVVVGQFRGLALLFCAFISMYIQLGICIYTHKNFISRLSSYIAITFFTRKNKFTQVPFFTR